jgi:hypothetical protein
MSRSLVTIFSLLFFSVLSAAPAPPTVRAEVELLLSRLSTSGCEFNRNGTWHSATDARAHLLKKLEYLERRNAIQSTESFIDLAASKSSASGQPYQVKCSGGSPTESKKWLEGQLGVIRASTRPRD